MGAIVWQVYQVKRKNSISTGRPSPNLTEAGALAESLSPREVAWGCGPAAVGVGRSSGVPVAAGDVGIIPLVATGAAGEAEPGAQADKTRGISSIQEKKAGNFISAPCEFPHFRVSMAGF